MSAILISAPGYSGESLTSGCRRRLLSWYVPSLVCHLFAQFSINVSTSDCATASLSESAFNSFLERQLSTCARKVTRTTSGEEVLTSSGSKQKFERRCRYMARSLACTDLRHLLQTPCKCDSLQAQNGFERTCPYLLEITSPILCSLDRCLALKILHAWEEEPVWVSKQTKLPSKQSLFTFQRISMLF